MMNDVISIGDAMITLNPTINGPMRYVTTFERTVGSSELNVLIGCSRLGLKSGWMSRLGKDEFGRYIYNFVRGEGVDVSEVELVEDYKTSINFREVLEDGSGRTFYYRDNSPTSVMTLENLNEEYIKNARVLHISGVFVSLDKEKNIKIVQRAIKIAKENNVLVTFDPNIRLRIWTKEEAKNTLLKFLPDVDVLLSGVDEAEILFGTKDKQQIIKAAKDIGIPWIILKQGEDGSCGYHDGNFVEVEAVKVKKVVDTVGAGDGFNVGFIYGLLNDWDLKKSLQFANLVGSMVVSVSGDNEGLPYLDEVLMRNGEKEFIER